MATQLLTERAADLGAFRMMKAAGLKLPILPQELSHIYIKLEFDPSVENASTAEIARGFLSSVARAAIAADHIAQLHSGLLLEAQGSTLHVGLQRGKYGTLMDSTNSFVSDLHWAYREIFPDRQNKRVKGWRMTADVGKTLVVVGRGVHHDDSYVSLGDAANRPAKHLYAQLAIPNEDDRDLKRDYVAVREPLKNTWIHEALDRLPRRLDESVGAMVKEARQASPKITYYEASRSGLMEKQARALPIAPGGSPGAPSPDRPHTYFGWVKRADLDGFSKRVRDCNGDDACLIELGQQFYVIMGTAADFTQRHQAVLAQLPWAGDNYTAAAVFPSKAAYDEAIPKRLVELTLDFEKELKDVALKCGFGGWAYGAAGGDPHGNAGGNVFLAGIEVDDRRFLVAVGEGVGRSTEGMTDIEVNAQELVVYEPDWARLHDPYKKQFEPAVNCRGQQSTLYRKAKTEGLVKVRAVEAAANSSFTISLPREQPRVVPTRPHYQ